MCGIAGYVGPDSAAQRDRVLAMAEAVAHRGPDDTGIWIDDHAVLALSLIHI